MGIYKDKYNCNGTAARVLSSTMTVLARPTLPSHYYHHHYPQQKVSATKAATPQSHRKWDQYSLKTHYRHYSQGLVNQSSSSSSSSSSSLSSLSSSSSLSSLHSSSSQQQLQHQQETGTTIPLVVSSGRRSSLNVVGGGDNSIASLLAGNDAVDGEPTLGEDESASFFYSEPIGDFPVDTVPTKQVGLSLPEWLCVDNITMATLRAPLEEFSVDSIPATTNDYDAPAGDGWSLTWFD